MQVCEGVHTLVIFNPCARTYCWVADQRIKHLVWRESPRLSRYTCYVRHWLGTMNQKTVLITGCSSGIGLALATHIAKDEKKRFMGKCDAPAYFTTALNKFWINLNKKWWRTDYASFLILRIKHLRFSHSFSQVKCQVLHYCPINPCAHYTFWF